jgi:hypothetical protein
MQVGERLRVHMPRKLWWWFLVADDADSTDRMAGRKRNGINHKGHKGWHKGHKVFLKF